MQSISQAKRQQQLIESGFLDLGGDDVNKLKPFEGDAIATALFNSAAYFKELAGKNLDKSGSMAEGKLFDSIIPTDIIIMGKVYTVNINVNDYYKFVDKGVKGWKNSQGDSPYSFKAPSGKRGTAPKNSKMVAAIKQWLLTQGKSSKGQPERRHAISALETKRNKITDATTSAAIKKTLNIRRYGLKKTNFWGAAVNDLEKYIATEFETALKIDVINSLTNGNRNK